MGMLNISRSAALGVLVNRSWKNLGQTLNPDLSVEHSDFWHQRFALVLPVVVHQNN